MFLTLLFSPVSRAQRTIRVSTAPPRDFSTIQAAINSAASGDTIRVAAGTYRENIDFSGKTLDLLGGYAPGFGSRDIRKHETVIDGGSAGSVVTFGNRETFKTRLEGFTIINGSATDGGGIIINNRASPIINNNIIRDNIASNKGGGICTSNSSSSTAVIINNLIFSNRGRYGGGIYCGSTITVENNTISGNTASDGGGVLSESRQAAILNNNVLSDNNSVGIECRFGGKATITYCNLWNNNGGDNISCNLSTGCTVNDPKFVDPNNDDYRLLPDSPCIDAGDPAILDPDGSRSDMGAYGGPAAYQETPGPLTAWWRFDEGSGSTAADSSGAGHDGSLVSGAGWDAGYYGWALGLNGSSAGIQAPITPGGTGSICLWFRAEGWTRGSQGTAILSDSNDQFGLYRTKKKVDDRKDVLVFTMGDGVTITSTTKPEIDRWYFVTVTWATEETFSLYVNGVLEGQTTATDDFDFDAPLNIGTWPKNSNITSFKGTIDDVKIFNKVLTAREVEYEYMGLVAYYTFDDNTGTTAKDETAHENEGTLKNGALWNTGRHGYAVNCAGDDDYVEVQNHPVLQTTHALTMAFWMKGGAPNYTYSHPVGIYDSRNNRHSATVYVTLDHQAAQPTLNLVYKFGSIGGNRWEAEFGSAPLDTWTHVAVTYDGSYILGYVNGEVTVGGIVSGEVAISKTDPFGIGCADIALDQKYFNGSLDEVRLYRRALSARDIREIMLHDYERPSITLTEPDGTDDETTTDTSAYTIQWTDSDPDSDAGINLYYTDRIWFTDEFNDGALDRRLAAVTNGYGRISETDGSLELDTTRKAKATAYCYLNDTLPGQYRLEMEFSVLQGDFSVALDEGATPTAWKNKLRLLAGTGEYLLTYSAGASGSYWDGTQWTPLPFAAAPTAVSYAEPSRTLTFTVSKSDESYRCSLTNENGTTLMEAAPLALSLVDDGPGGDYLLMGEKDTYGSEARALVHSLLISSGAGELESEEPLITAAPLSEDDPADAYVWDTAGINSGSYHILAVIDDTVHQSRRSISPGQVTVKKLVWRRAPVDPVLAAGRSHEWDGAALTASCVLQEGTGYKMWYTAHDGLSSQHIGLAESPNGVQWTKYGGNPVISIDDSSSSDTPVRPWVITEDGSYRIWYSVVTSSKSEVRYAVSPDGITWTGHSQKFPSAESPCVIKKDGRYLMYFTWAGLPSYATSSDGVTWSTARKISSINNAVSHPINSCVVTEDADGYLMVFSTLYKGKVTRRSARSPDAENWTTEDPFLLYDNTGQQVDDAALITVLHSGSGIYRAWYYTNDDTSSGLHLATTSAGAWPSLAFTEPDGLNDITTSDSPAYTIEWSVTDPDDNPLVALYYDEDREDFNGTALLGDITPDKTTLAQWQFEDSALDSSGHGNDGTVHGPVVTGGYIGQAYEFDGNDHVSTPLDIGSDKFTELTMMAWVLPRAMGNPTRQIFSNNDHFGCYNRGLFIAADQWGFVTGGNIQPTGVSITLEQWTHLALVYRDGLLELFVDGKNRYLRSVPTTGSSAVPLAIGYNPGINGEHFIGVIDEVMVFDRALSKDEIESIAALEPRVQGKSVTSYTWDTTPIPSGSYYLYARIDDGINPPLYVYSDYLVRVRPKSPLLTIAPPPPVFVNDKVTLTGTGDGSLNDLYLVADGMSDTAFDVTEVPADDLWTTDIKLFENTTTVTAQVPMPLGVAGTWPTIKVAYVPPADPASIKPAIQTTWTGPREEAPYTLQTMQTAMEWFDSVTKDSNGSATVVAPGAYLMPVRHLVGENDITGGLVGYWPFTDNASDHSMNGFGGTVMGATHRASEGVWGGCYYFDGLDDLIYMAGDDLLRPQHFTLSAHVKIHDFLPETEYYIAGNLSGGEGYALMLQRGKWALWTGGGQVYAAVGDAPIEKDTWYHLAGTFDGSTARLFVDGILASSITAEKTASSCPWALGSDPDAGTFAHCTLDEVSLYSRVLEDSEIASLAGAYHPVSSVKSAPVDTGGWNGGEDRTHFSTLSWVSPSKPLEPQVDESTVILWRFDGDGTDSSGHGYHGSVQNAVFTGGRFGQCLDFNGTNSYVLADNAPKNPNLVTGSLTFMVWFYPRFDSNDGTHRSIAGYHAGGLDEIALYNGSDGFYGVKFSAAGSHNLLSAGSFTANQWYHLAFTVEENTDELKIYHNGILMNSGTETNTIQTPSSVKTAVGSHPNAPLYFDGLIDEVAIYKRALTSEEIARLTGTVNPGVKIALRSAPPEVDPVAEPDAWGPWLGSLIFEDRFAFNNTHVWNYTGYADTENKKLILGNGSYYNPHLLLKDVYTIPYVLEADFNNLDYAKDNYWKMGFRINEAGTSGRIMFQVQNNGYRFFVAEHPDNQKEFINVTNQPKQANTWYNMKLSVDGETIQAFLDGEQVVSFTYSPPYKDTEIKLESMANYSSASKVMVDNFRISNLCYTATDDRTTGAKEGNLLHCRFENDVQGEHGEDGLASGVVFEPGKHGRGAYFPEGASLGYPTDGNFNADAGTIEMWIKPRWDPATASDTYTFFLLGTYEQGTLKGLMLYRTSLLNQVMLWVKGDTQGETAIGGSTAGWKTGEWHHLAATWNKVNSDDSDADFAVYLDGVQKNQWSVKLDLIPLQTMYIGTYNQVQGDFHEADSVIDEFKIYSYARSADQIAEAYSSTMLAGSASSWYVPVNPAHHGHRWLQYKAILENITPQVPPILSSVTINCRQYEEHPYLDMTTPKIVFWSDRDGNEEIYIMDADGANQTRLTDNGASDKSPCLSPDGTKIAFTTNRDGNEEIYVMDSDGSNPVIVTKNNARDFSPSFSPDGTKIAFTSDRDGNYEIYIMDSDGANQINVTNNSAWDDHSSFSPDGTKIAFASDRDGNSEIHVMDSDGSNPVNVTLMFIYDSYPGFSPDGTKIAFTRGSYSNYEIFTMDSNGSNQTRVTDNNASDVIPSFSPDGAKIAFVSDRDGSFEIYITDLDGTSLIRLTDNDSKDSQPKWWAPPEINPQAWHKFPINPVLEPTAGRFDGIRVHDPCVIKDVDGYKMWYVGDNDNRWRLGYADSTDGIQWTKYEGQGTGGSIFVAGEGIRYPCVIEDGGQYRLYWADAPEILTAVSSDSTGLNWISNSVIQALTTGPSDRFDSDRVGTPWVVKVDQTCHMWFGGRDDDGWDIGYATSGDGVNWTKHYGDGPAGSVLWHGMDPDFATDEVNGPRVIYRNGYFLMWYSALRDSKWDAIGFAYSSDGRNWTNVTGYQEDGATLTTGAEGAFDSRLISSPSVILDEGVYKMWYRGDDDEGNERIGYARTKVFTLDELQEFDSTAPLIESVEISSTVPGRFYPGTEDFPLNGYPTAKDYFAGPKAYWVNPKNGGENQTMTVTVDWFDDFPSNVTGSAAFGGGPVKDDDGAGGWVLTYTVPESALYSHPVTITCEDQAGNQTTTDITFHIDITAPTGNRPALTSESDVILPGYPNAIQLPAGPDDWFYRSNEVSLAWYNWNDGGGSGLPLNAYWSKLLRAGSHEFTNQDGTWMEYTQTALTFGPGSEDGSIIRLARMYSRDNVGNETHADSPDILHDTVTPTVNGLAVESAPDSRCALALSDETDPGAGGTLWYNPSQDISVALKPSWSDLNLYLAALETTFGQTATPHEPGSGSSTVSELLFTVPAASGDEGTRHIYLLDKAGNTAAVPLALKADTEPPVITGPIDLDYLTWKPAGYPGEGIAKRAVSAASPAIITVPESSVSDTLSGVRDIRAEGTDLNPAFTYENSLMLLEEGPPKQYKCDVTPSGVSGVFSAPVSLVAADLVDNRSQPSGTTVEVDMVNPTVTLLAPVEGGWDDGSVLVRWVSGDSAVPGEDFLLHKMIRFTSLVDGTGIEVPLTPLQPLDTFSDEEKNRLRLGDGGGWHTVVLRGDSGETRGDPLHDYLGYEKSLVENTAYSVEFEVVDAGGNSVLDTVNYWEYKPEHKEEGDLLAAGEKVDERPENLFIQATPDGSGGGGDVYFVTYSYGDADIVRIGLDGFGYDKVAAFMGSEEFSPTVSPDGKWLVFLSDMASPPQKTEGLWRATDLGSRAVWGKNLADGTVKLLIGQPGVSEVAASVCPLDVIGFEGTYLLAHVAQESGGGSVKVVALDDEAQPVGEEIEVLSGAWLSRCSLQWRTVDRVPCLVISGTERVGAMQSNRFVASAVLEKNSRGTLTAKRLRSPIQWQGALALARSSENGMIYASSPKAVKPHSHRAKIWRFAPQVDTETAVAAGALPGTLVMESALMTCGDGHDSDPSLSPDEELLAFSSLRVSRGTWNAVSPNQNEIDASSVDRDREIFIIDAQAPLRLEAGVTAEQARATEDENGLSQLTANIGKDDHSPRFTPESSRVVYLSKVRSTGLTDIRIINVSE